MVAVNKNGSKDDYSLTWPINDRHKRQIVIIATYMMM
jgi:hypothetical protein